MRPQTSYSWKARLAGMAFASMAWFVLLPSPVQAGCGDYPMLVHAKNGVTASPSTQQSEARSTAAPASHGEKKNLPCSGPNCSGRSNHPPAVPVVITSSTADHWLWLAALPIV